jgi:dihydrofolate reductase
MRKIIVLEFISLDGVIQGPGGPEEDTSGGFALGGWTSPHRDAVSGTAMMKQMKMPFDLLIGRRTFDIWARF